MCVPMLVFFADVQASALLVEARFMYTEVILYYIIFLYINPLANNLSNLFLLRCDAFIKYPIQASENEAEDFGGGYRVFRGCRDHLRRAA